MMCAKLQAAIEARSRDDFVIGARTDARGVEGIESAIQRAHRYLEAGADWVFPEAMESADEFRQFAQQVDAPRVADMTEFGKSPLLHYEELSDLGYAAIIYPVTLLRIAMKAMDMLLAVLVDEGTQRDLVDLMQTREVFCDLLDYDDDKEPCDG